MHDDELNNRNEQQKMLGKATQISLNGKLGKTKTEKVSKLGGWLKKMLYQVGQINETFLEWEKSRVNTTTVART